MKRYFHEELYDLRSKLILLGERSNEIARLAMDGLLENDFEKINAAYGMDDYLDNLEQEIAHACIRYITLRSPVSTDLRLLVVALKASHDFERIGDEAHSIAKKAKLVLNRDGKLLQPLRLQEMSNLTCQLVQDSITCCVEEDLEKANALLEKDREIDTLNQLHFDTFSSEDMQRELSDATRFDCVLISKSIERMGDHAKNIAREVIFLLNGDQ